MKNRYTVSALLLPLLIGLTGANPAHAQKRIYIAPDDHTDYMWSADEAAYKQAFLDMTDYYLNLADSTAGNPFDSQSRWNCDGSFWLWTYEKNKPTADFSRLMNRIKDGHFSAPLTTLVGCYGGTPAEAVLRGLYYAGRIERRYNTRFPLAVTMENQILPLGLASLWAGAGAKYSWRGVCNCATNTPNAGSREHEIYYWQGLDGSKVLMKWNSLYGLPKFNPAYSQYYPNDTLYGGARDANENIGGYAEARYPFELVDFVDGDSTFQAKYPYPVIGAFGEGWDYVETLNSNFVTASQMKANASRRVIVSNEQDFFQDFETNYGAGLPTETRTYGNEWELACATMQEVTAGVRRSVEKLRSAEALASLVSLSQPNFMTARIDARDLAFVSLGLYWEHDFVGGGPAVSNNQRADFQRRTAANISTYVDALTADASAALGGLIARTGSNLRFYVFNPLGETRTDFADFAYTGSANVHVVEVAGGQEVPSQIVTADGATYLRIQAANVPSVGYKVYEIVPGAGQNFGTAATVTGSVLENSAVKITVSNYGAITSLIDKTRSNKQFAKQVGGKWLNDLGASSGTLTTENAGPVSVTLLASAAGAAVPLDHTTRITLYRNSSRIDIQNDVNENFDTPQVSAFGFNLSAPTVQYEEVGAIATAKLTTNGGSYATRNARYDWQSLNHFADITGTVPGGGTAGVTLSNLDCSFMRVGNSSIASLDTATPQISPLIGGRVDSYLGITNQNGDTHFRTHFALLTHDAFDPTVAMKFALEHQNALVTGSVTGGAGSPYPAGSFTALTVSDPNVLLWSVKPAEEGIAQGLIVRAWNLGAVNTTANIALAQPITSAQQTTHIETNVNSATVTNGVLAAPFGGRQMASFRVLPSPIVSGKITLADTTRQNQPVTFQFRGTGANTFTRTQTLDTSGNFAFYDIPADTYQVAIKAAKWLQKVVPVSDGGGTAFGIAATLTNGDADNSNVIDIADFGILVNAYGGSSGGNYDSRADFNDDGTVDIADFGILVNGYGGAGDP